ncbi:enoyl-CoA hydratase/isomerase family protein [Tranquillimonas alkanivorans]|uniref:2-(1,2-epoxy-1,2-dihydrophenyl)acetyl-CoA isomerase n=1 Tax=Tranquillimonas alkanivorans TaxID=441119 RepID=A0A1I5URK7_9RHOB|nr:enoyl-CoA hydratase/isomerase family protein [Tranquillimonas alkanivorans]SFP97885.1 2-(1,2-epoxy-1,2-dihydrophenyl)acetyl-CoA isomerase [Tranquillimonas alkanivorans]
MSLVALERPSEAILRLELRAPRSNALEPGLLSDLRAAVRDAEVVAPTILLLTAQGRNFSTGGDVAAFRDAAHAGRATEHADAVVPVLQDIVLRLVSLPSLVVTASRGAITGGSAGLLFASDLAVVAPDCFMQPYYARVGFAPDGGWTALLPDRVGAARALAWQVANSRLTAQDLHAHGLAHEIAEEPENHALALCARLAAHDAAAMIAAKQLIWDAARRAALKARLDAEARAFRERIARPETLAGMERFLGGLAKGGAHA